MESKEDMQSLINAVEVKEKDMQSLIDAIEVKEDDMQAKLMFWRQFF